MHQINMKKQILILMLALLLIGNVIALNETSQTKLIKCKVIVDIKQATETKTIINKTLVMENKIVTTQVRTPVNVSYTIKSPDSTKWKSDLNNYNTQLNVYKNLTNKAGAIVPKYPVMTYIDKTLTKVNYTTTTQSKTIQVPKIINVTKYKIDFLGLKVLPYVIKENIYTSTNITINKLKAGYTLDEKTGKIYYYAMKVKC